jgi:deoxyhypusine monooxygenase
MASADAPSHEVLEACLKDVEQPIGTRMRCIFFLKQQGGRASAAVLEDGENSARPGCYARASATYRVIAVLGDRRGSTLLRHELAYVIGQMQFSESLPALEAVLRDTTDDPIVRHEAAEAIAAIGKVESLPLLREFCSDKAPEVSETCQIGVRSLEWQTGSGSGAVQERDDANPFESVDPAPPVEAGEHSSSALSVDALRDILVDESLPLFERYRAMFSLRNRSVDDSSAVLALCAGLEASSALFRHEIAYVLGQVASEESIEALAKSMMDEEEHPMVRHEAAEALGAVATPAAQDLLQRFQSSKCDILRESCEVALDAAEYFASFGRDDAVAAE